MAARRAAAMRPALTSVLPTAVLEPHTTTAAMLRAMAA